MKHSFIYFLCFLIMAAACPVSFSAEEDVKTAFVSRDMKGNERWTSDAEIINKQGDVYVMTEKGEGKYYGFETDEVSWVTEMEFESTEETVRPIKLEKRVFDDEGKIIRVENQNFDLDKKIATCTHKDIPKNISRTKKFKITKDIINRQLLGLYVQKLLENGKESAMVQMVSEEPGVYNIELSVVDKEDIDVNGQKRQAYKFSINPNLGLLNIAKSFFPKAYAWHSAEPEFELLRYEGLEGGIQSPKVEVTTKE
jgi:hypothetical protein